MKVLHILGELKPSGAETMLHCAAPYFKKMNVDNELLSIGPVLGVYSEKLESVGYVTLHIPFRKRLSFFIELFELIKKGKYDAVHIHSEKAGFWLALTCMLAGVPARRCVRTIHAAFLFTGLLRLRRALQRQILSRIGVPHVAISESVFETELSLFGVNTIIIHNWYDSYTYNKPDKLEKERRKKELGYLDSDFVVLSVGNCSSIKNHTMLIAALGRAGIQNIKYVHIGIESDPVERELAVKLLKEGSYQFVGYESNVVKYLYASDLYVMPSLHEGFGIAAIEAIATEVPTIFTNVPGLTDFDKYFAGLRYCKPTVQSIEEAIMCVYNSPKDSLQSSVVGNNEIAKRSFGIERGVNSYVTLYST